MPRQPKNQRPLLTPEQREIVWKDWRTGIPIRTTSRKIGRSDVTVRKLIVRSGGISPRVRVRNPRSLSTEDREEISRGLALGLSMRAIAASIDRAPSTVSREVTRNRGRRAYRAAAADLQAWAQGRRPQVCKLKTNKPLCRLVATKLTQDWSPAQISGWLSTRPASSESMTVSHETIYRTLFVQSRGALKKELVAHLRSKRSFRRARNYDYKRANRDRQANLGLVSIRERPAEADDRAVPGHWEGDLIQGSNNSYIATLVERATRFTMLVKVNGKTTEVVTRALARRIRSLPTELTRSLTWDRGTELNRHADFTLATGMKVYFCDPHSPWQRGTNENTNRLLRQYFPKGTPLDGYTQRQLNAVALRLNGRPRKVLGFRTPADTLDEMLR